jgi:hypothetical protein
LPVGRRASGFVQVAKGGLFAPALALNSSGVQLDSETVVDRASQYEQWRVSKLRLRERRIYMHRSANFVEPGLARSLYPIFKRLASNGLDHKLTACSV